MALASEPPLGSVTHTPINVSPLIIRGIQCSASFGEPLLMMIAPSSDTPTGTALTLKSPYASSSAMTPAVTPGRAKPADRLRQIDPHQAEFAHLANERAVEHA